MTAVQYAAEFADPDPDDGTGHWVVEEYGQVIGYFALSQPTDGFPALEVSVYLAPGMMGAGRGTSLINEFAKPVARDRGASVLTGTPHTDEAVRLLEKCGFSLRGTGAAAADPLAAKLDGAVDKKDKALDFAL